MILTYLPLLPKLSKNKRERERERETENHVSGEMTMVITLLPVSRGKTK
jgi:hypothetical protein